MMMMVSAHAPVLKISEHISTKHTSHGHRSHDAPGKNPLLACPDAVWHLLCACTLMCRAEGGLQPGAQDWEGTTTTADQHPEGSCGGLVSGSWGQL
jgi:hypothetical protein